jgi:lipocalin-like protein
MARTVDQRVRDCAIPSLSERSIMNRFGTLTLTALALLFLGVALPSGDAVGQQKTLKEQLVGTWTYVSVDIVRPDGSRVPLFGPNPSGLAAFDRKGNYLLLTARTGQPKFASNNRTEGTAEENKAVVQGSIAHFGRYTVNEADRTITFHIETSTFPNWNGAKQRRPITLMGDELRWTTAASSSGTAEVVLKRAE